MVIPKTEKAFALLISFFLVYLTLSLLWKLLGDPLTIIPWLKNTKKIVFLLIFSTILEIAVFPPIYFPENHTLVVKSETPPIVITEIKRIENPSKQKTPIPFSQLLLEDGWEVTNLNQLSSLQSNSSFTYTRFMQASIELILLKGPRMGYASISWDGTEQVINLYSNYDYSETIVLEPTLLWGKADLLRKLIIFIGYFSEIITLTVIFMFFWTICTRISKEGLKVFFIFFISVLILLPIVNLFNPVVSFKDRNLENSIRTVLKQPNGGILSHQLLTIVDLDIEGKGIVSLDGIEKLTNLESLNLRDNQVSDISNLDNLTHLHKLNLRGNNIQVISSLANLTELTELNLRGNPITDISVLSKLKKLKVLNLAGIDLRKQTRFLIPLTNLEKLNLRKCNIDSLEFVGDLMKSGALQDSPSIGIMAEIDIRDNPISINGMDGYSPIRPYWEKISYKAPFNLPEFFSLEDPEILFAYDNTNNSIVISLVSTPVNTPIFYTLDGSVPTVESKRYQTGLVLNEESINTNQLALIKDMSPKLRMPLKMPDQAVILRVKAIDSSGNQSKTITKTIYFPNQFESHLPIVSLVFYESDLFGYKDGIYVSGRMADLDNGSQAANYHQRGGEWERLANFELFTSSGHPIANQNSAIRIHGATTRDYAQKSLGLKIKFSNPFENENNQLFVQDLKFLFKPGINSLLLRNSGNNINFPFYRDNLLQAIMQDSNLELHTFLPVNLLFNGEYWGIYNLRENLDNNSLASRYSLNPENIVILERDSQINTGSFGDEKPYLDMLSYLRENDIRDPDNYEYISRQMDINNFIDYQIAEIYARNENWPHDNIKFWRDKSQPVLCRENSGTGCKWRWLLFDVDNGFGVIGGTESYKTNSLIEAESTFLFRRLLENEAFKIAFINRFADLLNTAFLPNRVVNIIDSMQSQIDPDLNMHLLRWNILEGSTIQWENNVNSMRIFAENRPHYLREHLMERFSLQGTYNLNIKTDGSMGYVHINSIDILNKNKALSSWDGLYFKDLPVEIEAIAYQGYRFKQWNCLDSTDNPLIIYPHEEVILEAIFEKVN